MSGTTTYISSQKARSVPSFTPFLPSHIQTRTRTLKAGRWKCVFNIHPLLHHPCSSQFEPPVSFASTADVASGLPASILAHFRLVFLKADRIVFLKMCISSRHSPRNPSVVSYCTLNKAHLMSRSASSSAFFSDSPSDSVKPTGCLFLKTTSHSLAPSCFSIYSAIRPTEIHLAGSCLSSACQQQLLCRKASPGWLM